LLPEQDETYEAHKQLRFEYERKRKIKLLQDRKELALKANSEYRLELTRSEVYIFLGGILLFLLFVIMMAFICICCMDK